MTIHVSYTGRHGWGSPIHVAYRPYAEIRFPLHAPPVRLWALLDSGADYLQLDSYWAHQLRIDPKRQGTPLSVTLAGGGTRSYDFVRRLTVEIEGKRVVVDCLFSTGAGATPLLGRLAFLAAVDVGLDVNGWLYKL